MTAALNLGATYIMVFASDIEISDNQVVLQEVAVQANGSVYTELCVSASVVAYAGNPPYTLA